MSVVKALAVYLIFSFISTFGVSLPSLRVLEGVLDTNYSVSSTVHGDVQNEILEGNSQLLYEEGNSMRDAGGAKREDSEVYNDNGGENDADSLDEESEEENVEGVDVENEDYSDDKEEGENDDVQSETDDDKDNSMDVEGEEDGDTDLEDDSKPDEELNDLTVAKAKNFNRDETANGVRQNPQPVIKIPTASNSERNDELKLEFLAFIGDGFFYFLVVLGCAVSGYAVYQFRNNFNLDYIAESTKYQPVSNNPELEVESQRTSSKFVTPDVVRIG